MTQSVIVVDASEPSYVQYGVKDLADYLKEITGTEVPIRTAQVETAPSLIVVGKKMAEQDAAGVLAGKELGPEGYCIKSVVKNGKVRLIVTGANQLFVLTGVEPTDSSGEVMVTTESKEVLRIEKSAVRPLIRGRDLHAWGYSVRDAIIWTHDDKSGEVLESLPKRAESHFTSHAKELQGRDDYKDGMPIWRGRGRDTSCLIPPAQIRTGAD